MQHAPLRLGYGEVWTSATPKPTRIARRNGTGPLGGPGGRGERPPQDQGVELSRHPWTVRCAKASSSVDAGKIEVQIGDGVPQTALQCHLTAITTLCVGGIGDSVWPVRYLQVELKQPVECG
jgi:hypothetical protein